MIRATYGSSKRPRPPPSGAQENVVDSSDLSGNVVGSSRIASKDGDDWLSVVSSSSAKTSMSPLSNHHRQL